ncbi:PIN domain-containing protein [Mobilicoccus massiliensis]|uniref:PIN domain-containing protein n=1 Tax=Mobilicoccus massiliensis TaxID=1522310 RepID=UPI00058BBB19|nr:PIN domain-containing protein [Mobilicoccus massiliensis]
MARFSVFFDACVLVPIALADTLLRLGEADLYRPLWSRRILDEMVSAVEKIHPDLADGRARRRAAVMDDAFDDAGVVGWEQCLTIVELPDPGDRHVVAAAVVGRADLIVTANVRDFPLHALEPFGLEVQHPDVFLLNQLDLAPNRVMRTLGQQAAATGRPTLTVDSLLSQLARCGVPEFAAVAARQKWRVDE